MAFDGAVARLDRLGHGLAAGVFRPGTVLAGSVMSGQSQWLYIGIVVLIVGLLALWWTYRRRR